MQDNPWYDVIKEPVLVLCKPINELNLMGINDILIDPDLVRKPSNTTTHTQHRFFQGVKHSHCCGIVEKVVYI